MKTVNIILFTLLFSQFVFAQSSDTTRHHREDTVSMKTVEIVGLAIDIKTISSPVTITKLESAKLNQLPAENIYSGLAFQKGVNATTSSLLYQTYSLRGFSEPQNESVMQLIDGVDNTPPGPGFSFGNLDGVNDIDIEKIEIIPGPSSAIYGPGAFSGIIRIDTKSPFTYQGLSAQVKSGMNHIDGIDHKPALYSDYQLRYAKSWSDRFAIKLTGGYMWGSDWLKLSRTDFDPSAQSDERGENNPGRDLANDYGDEIQQALPIGPNGSLVNVSRTGYDANELLGTEASNLKLCSSIHYRLQKESELSYQFRYAVANTPVGDEPYNLKDFRFYTHKLELRHHRSFIRIYRTEDVDGGSLDGQLLARFINSGWKSDSAWFSDYTNAFNGLITQVPPGDFQAARAYADIGRAVPGSELYNRIKSKYSSILVGQGGALYYDKSSLNVLTAQHEFNWQGVKLIGGIEGRLRRLYTEGTAFLDYPPPRIMKNDYYSAYLQAENELTKRLNVLFSVRFDKYVVFDATFTPRLAFSYKLTDKQFLRASFQTGTRTPDPMEQYQNYVDGNYYLIGGLPALDEVYHFHQRAFELASVTEFTDRAQSYIAQYGTDSIDAAIRNYSRLLEHADIKFIQPERVKTFEIGYRGFYHDRLQLDIAFFANSYQHLVNYHVLVMPYEGSSGSDDSLHSAATDILEGNINYFIVPVNADKKVMFAGVEAGFDYYFGNRFILSGNAVYENSDLNPDWMMYLGTTPPFKLNVSLSNPVLFKNVGFSVNWHWRDALKRYFNDTNPFINNYLTANQLINMKISFGIPSIESSLCIGATNLLNHYYLDIPNGSSIGGLYYVSFSYRVK